MPTAPAQTLQSKTWHLAGCLATLRTQVNQHWPARDHSSDGTIGDAKHAALGSGSDHNPWLDDTVRALDIDVDGIDAAWLAEQLRLAGAAGDPRLTGGGYVIYNRRITTADFSAWIAYDGADPHTSHIHASATRNSPEFEDTSPWAFLSVLVAAVAPAAAAAPADPQPETGGGAAFRAKTGDQGDNVSRLQEFLNRYAPAYSALEVDGIYGTLTGGVVAEFAHRVADSAFTPEDDREGLRGADGVNVGPRIARALARAGFGG